jgi:hypothetical protein
MDQRVNARIDTAVPGLILSVTIAAGYAAAWWAAHERYHQPDRPFWVALPLVAVAIVACLAWRREIVADRYGITWTSAPVTWGEHRLPRHEIVLVAIAKREARFPKRVVWDVVGSTRASGYVPLVRGYRDNEAAERVAAQVRAALGPAPIS